MVGFNIIASLVVMATNIFVSFNHTWELFMSGGLNQTLALAATIGCELTFIQSSLNMVVSYLMKRDAGFPVKVMFWLGSALVTWSNIAAGWGSAINVLVGVLLGLVPPVFLLGSKSVLSWSLLELFKDDDDINDTTTKHENSFPELDVMKTIPMVKMAIKNQPRINEKLVEPVVENEPKKSVELNQETVEKMVDPSTKKVVEDVVENDHENVVENAVENTAEPVAEPTKIVVEESVENVVEQQPPEAVVDSDESMESVDNQPTENTKEATNLEDEKAVVESNKELVVEPVENVVENPVEKTNENDGQNDQPTNHENDQSTNQIPDEPSTEKLVEQPTQKPTKRKKLTRTRNEKLKKAAKKWALDYYRKNGTLPGRLKIEKGAGCGQSVARAALEELKEELGLESKAS